ncbi:hypothetical protein Tco_0977831 [Tanacetum coccineum]|uniref:Phospholipase-like protein n=1 Tax=Tanacetum coccineum TaxID=301880 RepID=A0ABQ5ELF3_9ASTR
MILYDMPLIYYTEVHSLHFGRPEFALITGLPFGTVNFGLYTFGELKFRNRVFSYKLGLSVTNLDVIGVIEDEETFRKLCDEDSIRLCLILALEVIFMGRLLTCPVDDTVTTRVTKDEGNDGMEVSGVTDTLFRLVENLKDWNCFPWGEHIWTHLYDKIKNVIEKHNDEDYFGMKKDRMYVPTYTLSGFVFAFQESTTTTDIRLTIAEYDSSWWVLSRERNEEYGVLQFNEEFSSLGCDFMDSLNILFQDLIHPHYSDEDISNDFVVEDELRLCLEDEERMHCGVEKRRHEFMNPTHVKSILGKLTHSKRNHVDIVPGKTNPTDLSHLFHSLEIVWLTPDIEQFISQQGQVKCKITVGRNFWLTLACLDPSRKGWLSEEHIDLWVDYMWHGRPDNANWAMVSCYFVEILLQNNTPLFYANGDKFCHTS